jgi:hypothetical protein
MYSDVGGLILSLMLEGVNNNKIYEEPCRIPDSVEQVQFNIPTIYNGIVITSGKDTPMNILKRNSPLNEQLQSECSNLESPTVHKTVHKVFVLGHSHLKHCTLDLRSKFRYQVTGVIKPGARAKDIVKTTLNDIGNLRAHDVILNAGSNDMDNVVERKDLAIVLNFTNTFVQLNYGTNILILDLPYRQDLQPFSL